MGPFGEKCVLCQENTARNRDEYGRSVCRRCELEEKASREEMHICPRDRVEMEKEILQEEGLILNRCPACRGVWFDEDKFDSYAERENGHKEGGFLASLGTAVMVATTISILIGLVSSSC